MTLDWDKRIRMDCSSPFAMASMIANKDKFDVAWGCDTDHDRHGIVTRTSRPAESRTTIWPCAIQYLLFTHRPHSGRPRSASARTLVSSSMIDRVAKGLGRPMLEVPVGFKWFVDGLIRRHAGLRRRRIRRRNLPAHQRLGVDNRQGRAHPRPSRSGDDGNHRQGPRPALPASLQRSTAILCTSASMPQPTKDEKGQARETDTLPAVTAKTLAGEPITAILTEAPGNHAAIGGLKVSTENGWFAARPVRYRGCVQDLRGKLPGAGALDSRSRTKRRPL